MDIQRYAVKLDMKSIGAIDTGIRLKQGDSGMIFDFYIYNNGKIWTDSADRPSVVFNKSDGNIVYGFANSNGNTYSYTIIGEELTAAGTVTADVKFTLDNGRESTRTFTFYVEPDTLGAGAHESKSVISPVEKAVKDITETYLPKVEDLADKAEESAQEAKDAATSASGANVIDYDEETQMLSIKRDNILLDEIEVPMVTNEEKETWNNKADKSDLTVNTYSYTSLSLENAINSFIKGQGLKAGSTQNACIGTNQGWFTIEIKRSVNSNYYSGIAINIRNNERYTFYGEITSSEAITKIESLNYAKDVYGYDEWNSTTNYAPLGNSNNYPSYCIANGRLYEALLANKNAKPALNGGTTWKWIKLSELNSNLTNFLDRTKWTLIDTYTGSAYKNVTLDTNTYSTFVFEKWEANANLCSQKIVHKSLIEALGVNNYLYYEARTDQYTSLVTKVNNNTVKVSTGTSVYIRIYGIKG